VGGEGDNGWDLSLAARENFNSRLTIRFLMSEGFIGHQQPVGTVLIVAKIPEGLRLDASLALGFPLCAP